MRQTHENKRQSKFLIVTNRAFRAAVFAHDNSHRCATRAAAKPTGKGASATSTSFSSSRWVRAPMSPHSLPGEAGCNEDEGANVKNHGHLTLAIAGRMPDRANPSAYDSFCFARRRSILDYRDQRLGLKPSRRLSDSRPRSGAPPRPGYLGVGFKWSHASIQ